MKFGVGGNSFADALPLCGQFCLGLEPVLHIATVGFAVVFKEQVGAACHSLCGGNKNILRRPCCRCGAGTAGGVVTRCVCGAGCHGMMIIR